jgi:hypothetical protein
MRKAISPIAVIFQREETHDPRVSLAIDCPLVADHHELLGRLSGCGEPWEETIREG